VIVISYDIIPLGILFAVLGAIALAVQSLAVRYGTIKSPSSDALFVVLVLNISVLIPLAFVFEDPLGELNLVSFISFTAAGLVGTIIGRALYYEGIKKIGSSRAEPIKASQPLHASLVAIIVLGEAVSMGHLIAMIAIVIGIGLITYEHGKLGPETSGNGYAALALPFAAAFFFGIEPTFAKIGFEEGVSVLTGLGVKTIAAMIGYTGYLFLVNNMPNINKLERSEFPWLVLAGLTSTVFLLGYYSALELEPVSVVVPLVQASPLLVILLSLIFVRDDLEQVTWRLIGAATIVVIGAIGVTWFR